VAAICAPGSLPAAFAAKNASSTIPIVFATGGDPVAAGLVKSLSRPGGNVTGVSSLNAAIASKRLELLHQLAPDAKRYFALINPTSPLSGPFMREVEAGALKLGIRMEVLHATNEKEIEAAFASLPSGTGNALLSSPEPVLYSLRSHIAELAMRARIPTAFDTRDYVESGGLLSYGADFLDAMQRAGGYVARILKGEKPADLPVVQSEKFELAINLRTARALGIVVPANLLALADDVVE
jgi:putative ABC transport system substrate-binding protein